MTKKPKGDVEQAYRPWIRMLGRCQREVQRLLENAIADLGNPHLMRGRLDEARVKPVHSVVRKCKRKGLGPEDLLNITDLVGFRIVCANLEDIPRLAALIGQIDGLKTIKVQDRRTPDGYRATHVDLLYSLRVEDRVFTIPCEVQIRTFFQDGWARQTHRDLYKGNRIPPQVRKLSKSLAGLLVTADEIAQQIREGVSQRRPVRGKMPAQVTENGLALIYQRAFGEPAPDYLLKIAKRECEAAGVERLDALDRLLTNKNRRRRLTKAYKEGAGFSPGGYESHVIFELAPLALARGIDVAIKEVQKRAVADQAEVENQFRREALSDLPRSFDGFLDKLTMSDKDDDPQHSIQLYASAFGSTTECAACSTTLISEYDFAAAVQEHYRVNGRDDEILQGLWSSGIECGTGLCSYCSYVSSKD